MHNLQVVHSFGEAHNFFDFFVCDKIFFLVTPLHRGEDSCLFEKRNRSFSEHACLPVKGSRGLKQTHRLNNHTHGRLTRSNICAITRHFEMTHDVPAHRTLLYPPSIPLFKTSFFLSSRPQRRCGHRLLCINTIARHFVVFKVRNNDI